MNTKKIINILLLAGMFLSFLPAQAMIRCFAKSFLVVTHHGLKAVALKLMIWLIHPQP